MLSSHRFAHTTEDLEILGEQDYYDKDVWINQMFCHLGFAPHADSFPPVAEKKDAYVQYDESTQTPPGQKRFLWDHPIACRSFAVSPPVQKMHLLMPRHPPSPVNEYGVTVWDVQHAFRSM